MIGRIVEVASNGVHLSVDRGFMAVSRKRERIGQVALDDMSALIVHGHGATFSATLLTRLAERGAPVVMCGSNHLPVALVWPINGHYEQGLRMEAQAAASKPTHKRLWRDLVKTKLLMQAAVLDASGSTGAPLRDMAKRVRVGDPENLEAQAARRYWPALFGPEFRRNRAEAGRNAYLNFGYMVLRAGAARSILAAGLHPSLSIQHVSRGTALRLADDLMEPFRPFVDWRVVQLDAKDVVELDPEAKAALAGVMSINLQRPAGVSSLQLCLDRLATSLAQVYLGERKTLELPCPPVDPDPAMRSP